MQVDILLAQPLRLGAMAQEAKVDLSRVQLLVLDEADKLFGMGFTEQVGGSTGRATTAALSLGGRQAGLPAGAAGGVDVPAPRSAPACSPGKSAAPACPPPAD